MPTGPDLRDLLAEVRVHAAAIEPGQVLAGLVEALARHHRWTPPGDLRVHRWTPAAAVAGLDLPASLAGPDLLGLVLEASMDSATRRAMGAHYTPGPVAAALTGIALETADSGRGSPGDGRVAPTVLDPACGGGAFLVVAADRLAAAGFDPATIVRQGLWGWDRDHAAVAAAEAAMALWAWLHGDRSGAHPGANLVVRDAIAEGAPAWSDRVPDGVDVVVGNPPFLGQLGRATARTPEETAAARANLGSSIGAYTDAAALFLLVGARAVRPGGAVSLILPTSVLGARDAAPVRAAVSAVADLVGLWTADDDLFEANVRVCAPVLRRHADDAPRPGDDRSVRRWHGTGFEALPPVRAVLETDQDASWSPLVADLHAVPDVEPVVSGTLSGLARATAGFRSQYYGLVDHVCEAPDAVELSGLDPRFAPLVTVGLIDLGRCAWGERDARFARQRWRRPAIDLVGLRDAEPDVARWVDDLQVPKVLVATQTRVGEAAIDEVGTWVPSVPTIAVVAPAERLWAVAAVICSPVATALAVRRTAGTALSARAIKLSARQVLELPCPGDSAAWEAGAVHLRDGDLERFADAMAAAYGLDPDHPVTAWWHGRRGGGPVARR